MFATALTVASVAALAVGGRIDDARVHIRRTSAERWDLWTAAHQVTVQRDARTWCVAEQCAGEACGTAIGAEPALFDAVKLALTAL